MNQPAMIERETLIEVCRKFVPQKIYHWIIFILFKGECPIDYEIRNDCTGIMRYLKEACR